jgi:hypothetical protein
MEENLVKTQALSTSIALALALALVAAPAHAQQARTFVSAITGNDAGNVNCLITSPCRTFQHAHDQTLANGEVTVIDPGSYGAATITKNISIVNDGVGEAGILVSGGNTGITVTAAGAAATLRGLTIKGIGFGGGNGINFTAGKALNVENLTIRNLDTLGNGILFQPDAAVALTVTNTTITDNSANAIFIVPSGTAAVTGVLDHVGLYNNGFAGLNADGAIATGGTINVTVNASIASNNGTPGSGGGFISQSNVGKAVTNVLLFHSLANTNPSNGIVASGTNAFVQVSESAVWFNNSGWLAVAGGQIASYLNNVVFGNTSNGGGQSPASFE